VLLRFLIYGALGWCLEVAFTGVISVFRRDPSATAKTYLWMHPIYGATALILERVHDSMAGAPWFARGFVYLAIIYDAFCALLAGFLEGAVEDSLGGVEFMHGSGGRTVNGEIG
jgi:hypothetical protein